MRFTSRLSSSAIHAVTGVNTVSFGIDASKDMKEGLLGFAVERYDHESKENYVMPGFKVFKSVMRTPSESTVVSTWDHPIQSFVWDDFTAKPNHEYTYKFFPLKGTPKNIKEPKEAEVLSITVKTEDQFSKKKHDIFFNRGVASSQAYAKRFHNAKPSKLPPKEQKEAYQWLSRELDEALIKFIDNAEAGDGLRCCFYEFRYEPVLIALKKAIKRRVDVKIIIDAKVNESVDKKGKIIESFPREENLRCIAEVGIPEENYTLREAKSNDIQHNKFMVLLKGVKKKPTEVWTGSTNISESGLFGQTNVGHWVRDDKTAEAYLAYWDLLEGDPGGKDGDDRSTVMKANKAFKDKVEALLDVPTALEDVPEGITPVFSPRSGLDVLKFYASLLDSGKTNTCVTLAFGINAEFKELLSDNNKKSPIIFMLLEKKDAPNPRSKKDFVEITVEQNVYQAWGAFINNPVYKLIKETYPKNMLLSKHVSYIHSKFLLKDPLSDDPLVVAGSANFSAASTNSNDENMLVIRGDQRVADIYFTEFNRLFNHYYFRSVYESINQDGPPPEGSKSVFLDETDEWQDKYKPGSYRQKRLDIYKSMKGAKELVHR